MLSFLVNFAASCKPESGSFLSFPTWFKYLSGIQVEASKPDGTVFTVCNPQIIAIGDVWLIVAAIIEILIRVAALIALVYVIWGGIKYIISRGEPDKIAQAKQIIIDGVIGLIIAVAATAIVNFAAGSFS